MTEKVYKETYISVDIEASGPIPEVYSMLSVGACVIGDTSKTFYVELKPLNDNYIQQALDVTGFSMEKLKKNGTDPRKAMKDFEKWIKAEAAPNSRAVFVSLGTFDWMFVQYYLYKYLGRKPFGFNGIDIKSYYMGMANSDWKGTTTKRIRKKNPRLTPKRKHTHNALDDAISAAELFEKILEFNSEKNKTVPE